MYARRDGFDEFLICEVNAALKSYLVTDGNFSSTYVDVYGDMHTRVQFYVFSNS